MVAVCWVWGEVSLPDMHEVPPGATKRGSRGRVTLEGRREALRSPLSRQQVGRGDVAVQGSLQPLGTLGIALV